MTGARIRGHPIHPVLVIFPLSLLASSLAMDLYGLATRSAVYAEAATWALAAAALAGAIALIPGVIDWIGFGSGSRPWRTTLLHAVFSLSALALMLVSWLARREAPAALPGPAAIALSAAAAADVLVGFWLGRTILQPTPDRDPAAAPAPPAR